MRLLSFMLNNTKRFFSKHLSHGFKYSENMLLDNGGFVFALIMKVLVSKNRKLMAFSIKGK
ncbi:Uncharacterised protein [Bartonella vinsonii]|uniref:Uncharacterized protein n=1 Tax=Bartonella vinsonii TaxID=33047 RepID=A0A3S4YYP1_BARVI|nr:Uncharacterised protein [Bartonella vinsonii]